MTSKHDKKRVPLPRPILEIKLTGGRSIIAVQLHMGFTYGTHQAVIGGSDQIKKINMEMVSRNYPAGVLWARDFPSVILKNRELLTALDSAFPLYKMTALFESERTDRRKGGYSALVINWFQDEPEPLFSKENRRALLALDWRKVARNYES
jgi:hypothetical protein